HDVGKISVPIEILTKPSRLEDHEWAFIKKHPEAGYKILTGTHFVKEIEDIVLLHHENQDGSGYPHGLKGEEIPLGAAIVSVADGLDAIAGTRPYRKASSFIEAIKIMEGEANKYRKEVLVAARQLVESGQLSGPEFGVMSSLI
ncbi:MAG: HD domain-containing protein, partial [Porticoccus sp.]|nr:HD domain-containing protein [Porticoccus sp.]